MARHRKPRNRVADLRTIHEGGIYRVEAQGEFDSSNVDQLNAALKAAFGEDDHASCLLDLSAVTFIDSSVIGVLIRWANDAQLSEREALAIAVPDQRGPVYRLFQLVGITGFLPLFSSLAAAQAALREGQKERRQRRLNWLTDAELVTEHAEAATASAEADERLSDVQAEQERRDDPGGASA